MTFNILKILTFKAGIHSFFPNSMSVCLCEVCVCFFFCFVLFCFLVRQNRFQFRKIEMKTLFFFPCVRITSHSHNINHSQWCSVEIFLTVHKSAAETCLLSLKQKKKTKDTNTVLWNISMLRITSVDVLRNAKPLYWIRKGFEIGRSFPLRRQDSAVSGLHLCGTRVDVCTYSMQTVCKAYT